MSAALERLISVAYRHSRDLGKATEAVFKGKPCKTELDQVYGFIMQHGGTHVSFEVYMELVNAVNRHSSKSP